MGLCDNGSFLVAFRGSFDLSLFFNIHTVCKPMGVYTGRGLFSGIVRSQEIGKGAYIRRVVVVGCTRRGGLIFRILR